MCVCVCVCVCARARARARARVYSMYEIVRYWFIIYNLFVTNEYNRIIKSYCRDACRLVSLNDSIDVQRTILLWEYSYKFTVCINGYSLHRRM